MIIGDRAEWYLDLDLVWHSSEAWIAFVLPVSVRDRPLHWVLGKSQTYYSEHILVYGRREGLLLSCHGFWLFLDRLSGWFLGRRSLHHTESWTQRRGLGVQVWTGTKTP